MSTRAAASPPTEKNVSLVSLASVNVEQPSAEMNELQEHTLNAPQASPNAAEPSLFSDSVLTSPHRLSTSRYHRQLLVPCISVTGQTKLSGAKVLIIGLGGLGSPASLYLAGCGLRMLGLVDSDTVELSNLHRQIVHRERTVGVSKVDSAIQGLRQLNSEVEYVGYRMGFTADNALEIAEGYDLVLDCTDNPATRYLISDVCVLLRKPLVSAAAQRSEGQLMVLNYPPPLPPAEGKGEEQESPSTAPCYRCIFPIPPAPDTVQTCSEIGILGPVVGAMGVLMATEAIKILVATQEDQATFKPSLLLYSAWSKDPRATFRAVGLRRRRKDCIACGEEEVVKAKGKEKITREALQSGRMDYVAFCGGVVQDVRLLGEGQRIDAKSFLERVKATSMQSKGTKPSTKIMETTRTTFSLPYQPSDAESNNQVQQPAPLVRPPPLIIDVREEVEFALGAKVQGSINIPISKILRHRGGGAETAQVDDPITAILLRQRQQQNESPRHGQSTNTINSGNSKTWNENEEDDEEADDNENVSKPTEPQIYFICQRGNDSQIAAKWFLDHNAIPPGRGGGGSGGEDGKGNEGDRGDERSSASGRRGWVGDVKGGIRALLSVEEEGASLGRLR